MIRRGSGRTLFNSAPVNPDPSILEQVGDVERPKGCFDFRGVSTEHLPGRVGFRVGLQSARAWLRDGAYHFRRQVDANGPVFRTQVVHRPYIAISDPNEVMRVLRNSDRQWSTAIAWRSLTEGLEQSAETLDMPATFDFGSHTEIRRAMQPAFAGDALKSYVEIARGHFAAAADEWVQAGAVSFKRECRTLFAAVANHVFLGVDNPAAAKQLDRTMQAVWKASIAVVRNRWLSPAWRNGLREYEAIKNLLRSQVDERRAGDGVDMFSRLCRGETSSIDWLDDEGLVRLMVGVMSAAFDTTSAAVTSMAYLLAQHPEWQERARNEPETLDWVWKETMRIYPVASSVPRTPLCDVEVLGYRIPAGSLAMVELSSAMMDPEVWTDPERFDPERFSPARREDKRHPGVFIPFGSGPHACIGAQLSTLEARAFWTELLERAAVQLRKPYRARHQFTPIGIVSGPVALTVTPRS